MTNDEVKEELQKSYDMLLGYGIEESKLMQALEIAIKAIDDLKKARKEANRYKRKYLMLKAENETDKNQKDTDVLPTWFDKYGWKCEHCKKRGYFRNCPFRNASDYCPILKEKKDERMRNLQKLLETGKSTTL